MYSQEENDSCEGSVLDIGNHFDRMNLEHNRKITKMTNRTNKRNNSGQKQASGRKQEF